MKSQQDYKEKLWMLTERVKIHSPYVLQISKDIKIDPNKILLKKYYTLELGPGWGEVALEMAGNHPDTGFFLAEKKIHRVKYILQEIERRNLENIRILVLNFNWFFREIFAKQAFNEIVMNFPDPWPKTRHKKHRSFDKFFLEDILFLLKKDGIFQFATDHGGYARDTIRLLRMEEYKDKLDYGYDLKRENIPISYFENIQKKEGKRIYYISFRKTYEI